MRSVSTGPAAQLLGGAGDDGRHLDGVVRFALALNEPLQVLDGVVPARVELVQLRGLSAVAGRDRGPPEGHRGEVVGHARDTRQVGLGRRPLPPGDEVDHLGAATVGRARRVVVEVQVAGRVAGAEVEVARRPAMAARTSSCGNVTMRSSLTRAPFSASTARAFGESTSRPGLQDVERSLLEALELLRAVVAHREVAPERRDGRALHVGHGAFIAQAGRRGPRVNLQQTSPPENRGRGSQPLHARERGVGRNSPERLALKTPGGRRWAGVAGGRRTPARVGWVVRGFLKITRDKWGGAAVRCRSLGCVNTYTPPWEVSSVPEVERAGRQAPRPDHRHRSLGGGRAGAGPLAAGTGSLTRPIADERRGAADDCTSARGRRPLGIGPRRAGIVA